MEFFGKKGYAKFREATGSNDADVSLAVTVVPQLPVPPYPSMDESVPKKPAKLVKTEPVRIVVGREYDLVTTGVIARVRIEKIWQEPTHGNATFLIVSQKRADGRRTHAMSISQFKQRLLAGGVPEVTI